MSLNAKELFPELRVGDVVVKNRLNKRSKTLIGEVVATKEYRDYPRAAPIPVVGVKWRSKKIEYYYASQLERLDEIRLEDYE